MSANGTTAQIASQCSCRGCGATAAVAVARVTGAWSVSGERAEWACPVCTRDQLQEIEAGLTRMS
jgi:rubredoxin